MAHAKPMPRLPPVIRTVFAGELHVHGVVSYSR